MGHVRRGDGSDHVGEAGAVLSGADAGDAGYAGEGVLHMRRGLLVAYGQELNARVGEEV